MRQCWEPKNSKAHMADSKTTSRDDRLLYPEPPPTLSRLGPGSVASFLGPGIIIASVTIGSGELVWASRSGAIFGYMMLWCFLYAGVFKAIQVYTAARHMTLTGEHPLVAWSVPRRFPIFPLLIAVPAICIMPLAFSGIPEILGGFIHRLVGMSPEGDKVGPYEHLEFWINLWSSLVLCGCMGLALVSSYSFLERISTIVLGVMVTCVGLAVITFGPDLIPMLQGMFKPSFPDEFPGWVIANNAEEFAGRHPWADIALYLAAVGGGAYDYIGYVGMLREKRWGLAGRSVASLDELKDATEGDDSVSEENIRRARIWQRAPFLDTAVSFTFVIIVTLLFAILGTLVLNTEQVAPANNDLLNEQETFLTKLHPHLKWIYRGGVFLAFIGTVYGAFEVYRHTFIESLRGMVPGLKSAKPKTLTLLGRIVIAYCFLGGILVVWLPTSIAGSIVSRMTFGSVITGAAACGIWCFAMVFADFTRVPKNLRMSKTLLTLTIVAGVAMSILGYFSILHYFNPPIAG